MIRKGTVADVRSGALSRAAGHLAVVMCRYPRGLSKKLIDEYIRVLAPDAQLLDDFHAERGRLNGNHNAAFLSMNYQKRFRLSVEAVAELRRLAELARERDVYLICQCANDQRCHRELLLICARRWFGVPTEQRKFSYPEFESRVPDDPAPLQA